MKIEIDLKNKTIEILSNEKLEDIFHNLNSLFPDEKWKEYTLTRSLKSNTGFQTYGYTSTTNYDINDAITNVKYFNS
jgi:hypothetical protein